MVYTVGIFVFENYETLDAHGPIEFLGLPMTRDNFKLVTVAEKSGTVRSKQGVAVLAEFGFDDCPPLDILLVPGGLGVRKEVSNEAVLGWLNSLYSSPTNPLKYLLSVCTGSWLLARAGLLDGKKATSNKFAWEATVQQSDKTVWIRTARWVHDGNIITASGVSAGMDMTLYFLSQVMGEDVARQAANFAEYAGQWTDPSDNPWGKEQPSS